MVINKEEKALLLDALETEHAKIKRAANAVSNQGIKDIYAQNLIAISALAGRISNEVAK